MTVVCVDLDRTVIYSAAALDLREPDHEAPRLLCVEVYKGAPQSFLTEDAAATMRALQDVATVVPTTTRTPAQLARVHLPGPPAPFAIASNGGHLLVDGVADPGWDAAVRHRLAACAPLAEVQAHVRACSGPFVLALREASELFVYAVVDRAALPDGWVDELAAWSGPRGWTVSLQGRKIYAVPKPLTKSAAMHEVARRTGADLTLAAGDSLLDADLLLAADRGWRPGHGELADAAWTAPAITALPERGVLAGERILREFLKASRAPR